MSNDARLLELAFLSDLSRRDQTEVTLGPSGPNRDMIVHLLMEGMVSDTVGFKMWSTNFDEMATYVIKHTEHQRQLALVHLFDGQPVRLRINHKGRIRLAELQQAIKTGREREPFGILLNARYWERDLRVALLAASKSTPVALCFLDMNGLKAINDSNGHEAGNEAIRTFLRVVAANVEGSGDAYRYGGDEVVVILPDTDADKAGKLMASILNQLGEEKLKGIDKLTASCGVGATIDPEVNPKTFSEMVDKTQYRAKSASKGGPHRRSVLMVGEKPAQVF
jgi:diguanylate cyclase (GGDEF)-like protein